MGNIIHVGGARGVGKTTLLQKYVSLHTDAGIFEYGQEMRSLAKKRLVICDDSQFSSLDHKVVKELRKSVFYSLLKTKEKYDNLFVSGHYAIPHKGRLISTFNGYGESIYDHFVLVIADISLLKKRILEDGKYREFSSYNKIKEYLSLEMKIGKDIASNNNKELAIINNNDLEESILALKKYLN